MNADTLDLNGLGEKALLPKERLVTPLMPPLSALALAGPLGAAAVSDDWDAGADVAAATADDDDDDDGAVASGETSTGRCKGEGLFLYVVAGMTTWAIGCERIKPEQRRRDTSVVVELLFAAAMAAMSGRPSVLRTTLILMMLP